MVATLGQRVVLGTVPPVRSAKCLHIPRAGLTLTRLVDRQVDDTMQVQTVIMMDIFPMLMNNGRISEKYGKAHVPN
jgi:hypothetical protein